MVILGENLLFQRVWKSNNYINMHLITSSCNVYPKIANFKENLFWGGTEEEREKEKNGQNYS